MIKYIITSILILSFCILNAQNIKYKTRPIITKPKDLIELENDISEYKLKLKKSKTESEKLKFESRIIKSEKTLVRLRSLMIPFGKILDKRYLVYENNFIGFHKKKNGSGGTIALGYKTFKNISLEVGFEYHKLNYNNAFTEIENVFRKPNFTLYNKLNGNNSITIASIYLGNSFYYIRNKRTIELKLKYGLSTLRYKYNYILFRQENNSNYSDVISLKDTLKVCFNPAIQLKHFHKIGRNFLVSENIELGNYFINHNDYYVLQQNAEELKRTSSIPTNQKNMYYKIGLGIVYRIYSKYYNNDQEKIKQKMADDFEKYRM